MTRSSLLVFGTALTLLMGAASGQSAEAARSLRSSTRKLQDGTPHVLGRIIYVCFYVKLTSNLLISKRRAPGFCVFPFEGCISFLQCSSIYPAVAAIF